MIIFVQKNEMVTDFINLKNLLINDRTCRRFDASKSVDETTLLNLVELTRYCASGRNLQPLKYRIVTDCDERNLIFPSLKWAGYYTDWDGPDKTERPAAYLVQCLDTQYGNDCLCDDGLQLQAITLGATSLGLRCCIIKAFNAAEISARLEIPDSLKPRYVVAIGYPAEEIVVEDMNGLPDDSYIYYRDSMGRHHVPKRKLSELIIKC